MAATIPMLCLATVDQSDISLVYQCRRLQHGLFSTVSHIATSSLLYSVQLLIEYRASPMSDVTRILSRIEAGDPDATEGLLPLVYEELRRLAARRLAEEKPGQTLQATALVHEA